MEPESASTPIITVDELVARMRSELSRGDAFHEQAWGAVQSGLSLARQNAEIGNPPPLRPWQGALRPVARTAANAVLFLSRFITDAQIRFNVNLVSALTALVAGTRRLEAVSVANAERTDVRLSGLEQALSRLQADLTRLEEQCARPLVAEAAGALEDRGALDELYAALEDRFRGTRAEIKSRLTTYLPLLEAAGIEPNDRLIDVGCGRGEWLELLRDHGRHAEGIDINGEMIARCRALDLDVVHADAIAVLRELPTGSIALLTAIHVVEHLPFPTLIAFLSEASRVMRRDGLLILETPNPENARTATHDFHLDPTHQKPIPALLLVFLAEANGFDRIVVSAEADRSQADYALVARRP